MGRRGGGMRGGMGGGMRGGGGRIGGGLSGGSGRIGGGARPSGVRAPVRTPAPRVAAPRAARPRGGAGSFGMGMATGMMLGGRRRNMWGWGGDWGRPRHGVNQRGGPVRGGGGCGCFTMILAVFVLIIVISVIGQMFNFGAPGGGQVTRSTVQREALSRSAADSSVPLIVDANRWIANRTEAERGLHNFHNATGVRPILYITDNINGAGPLNVTEDTLRRFAETQYTAYAGDNQAHLLFLFVVDNFNYSMWVQPGNATHRIMDGEAIDILMDYVERFWSTEQDNSRMFSRAFDRAGTSIMSVHRSPWITVLIVAGVLLILFLLYTWWKAKQDRKREEAAETERILGQDLTEFGSSGADEASKLAQMYEDDNKN
ncbi:MAG: hypothetical protein FWE90_11165 [Defluviitaleaceae bacterium]|nr:hypothetical protein [Defluviitaleaceae bacterium]